MELKEMMLSSLILVCLGIQSVLSVHFPEQIYHDHLGVGPIGGGNVIVDYYSRPKYAFGYEVDGLDEYFRELSHGRWEIRDGDVVKGQYRVLLPDGRTLITSYIADKFGYRPTLQYINKGFIPPPPPEYAHVKIPQFTPAPAPIPAPIIEDPYLTGTYGSGFGYYGHGPEPFLALGSSRSGKRVAKKRALLYDRTLFRKDVERKRRSGSVSPSPTPVTVTVAPSSGTGRRKLQLTPAEAYNTK